MDSNKYFFFKFNKKLMELEKIMKTKIILFTSHNFYLNFKNILLKLAYELYIKKYHDLLSDRLEKNKNNNSPSSKWFDIMKLMFSKIYILDFSKITDLENKKDSNLFHINNLRSYEIDKLQYLYLRSICIKKLKKLNFLSFKIKISLINIVEIYCDLCLKEILNKRNKNFYKTGRKELLLFNRHNGINNLNKKLPFFRLENKRKSIRLNTFMFNSLFKGGASSLNNNNKNKKQIEDEIKNKFAKTNNILDIFKKKGNSARQKLLYCKSFTRLFIGETDKESILQRHLSNIIVFKENNLNTKGSYVDSSEDYIKKIFNTLYQKNSRKLLIDDYLKKTFEKYEDNQKYLDEFNKKDTNTPRKKFLLKRYSKFNNEINFPLNNKVDLEEKILNTYNYGKNKNKLTKRLRKINSAKINNVLNINNKKDKKKKGNESSILIENLCKELSDSICISKNNNNNKSSKKKLWIKTENNNINNKYYNFGKNYNYSYYSNHKNDYYRTNTYHSLKKECFKKFFI